MPGLELADSWSCDAHKTLNSGYDCGLVFCKRREAIAKALTAGAPYLVFGDKRDSFLYTTEMSRRAYGIVLWSIMKNLGAEGVAAMVDDMCANTIYFGEQLEKAGIEPVLPPSFNQLMIRFGSDEKTSAVLDAVQKSGRIWCGPSTWKGEKVIRLSVSSYSTTREDIDEAVAAIKEAEKEAAGAVS